MRRPEVGAVDALAVELEPATQDLERAEAVERLGERVEDRTIERRAVLFAERLPERRLALLHEREEVARGDGALGIERGGLPDDPPLGGEPVLDGVPPCACPA